MAAPGCVGGPHRAGGAASETETIVQKVIEFLRGKRKEHLDWAVELCRIPSISTQEEHAGDVRAAVEWTRAHLEQIGMKAKVHDTARHPLVYAEWLEAGPDAPTYLVYGHMDVQPEGDLSLWDNAPFEPTIKDDWLIARGSADDKGQTLLHVRAAQAWLATAGKLPINLKFLVEGEEEIGSPSLEPFIREHTDLLACDGIIISDTGMFEDGLPTITYGTRGLCYKEVRLHGPRHNLHSGQHGGPVTNPANALARLIASLHDDDGKVNIPGYYQDVQPPSEQERRQIALLPFDEKKYAEDLGVPAFGGGETDYSINERRGVRPTLDVNGIYGGYMDEGASTVIPATAGAKISMRLVPRQSGAKISAQFEETVRSRVPDGVRCEIIDHAYADAYMTPLEWSAMEAAQTALRDAFDHETAFVREGGSLPILPMFKEVLGADSLMLGFASPTCNAHGPNEKVRIPDLDRGAEAIARLYGLLAR